MLRFLSRRSRCTSQPRVAKEPGGEISKEGPAAPTSALGDRRFGPNAGKEKARKPVGGPAGGKDDGAKGKENVDAGRGAEGTGAAEKPRPAKRGLFGRGAPKTQEPAIHFAKGECACVVDKEGALQKRQLDAYCRQDHVRGWGTDYVVVGTLGKQQIGKSTFLNAMFDSQFRTRSGLRKELTTEGVWVSAVEADGKRALVLDVEGCDGKERGNDKLMERQLGLLSLVVCNVLVVHVPEVDVGCEDAANKTLLRIIIEEKLVNFPTARKTLLHFVIRDFLHTANDKSALEADMLQMFGAVWREARKPSRYAKATWSDIFDVRVSAFPDLRQHREECEGDLVDFRKDLLSGAQASAPICPTPVLAFSDWLASVWTKVQENGALDLPGTIALFAQARAHRAARRALAGFDAAWSVAAEEAEQHDAESYGDLTTSLVDVHMSEFDKEVGALGLGAKENDVEVKAQRSDLEERILSRMRDAFLLKAGALKASALASFDEHVSRFDASRHGAIGDYLARGLEGALRSLRCDLLAATVAGQPWDQDAQVTGLVEGFGQEMQVITTIECLRASSSS